MVLRKEYQSLFPPKKKPGATSQQAKRRRSKFYCGHCIVYYKPYPSLEIKTACKRKVGKATVRNYYKRRVRHILRELNFNETYLLLAIILKAHKLTFQTERKLLFTRLRPLIGLSH